MVRVVPRDGPLFLYPSMIKGQQPTVVFFPEGAYGPTNNCVGIGSVSFKAGRLAGVARRLQAAPGTTMAAESIESLMRSHLPIPAST